MNPKEIWNKEDKVCLLLQLILNIKQHLRIFGQFFDNLIQNVNKNEANQQYKFV